MLKRKTGIAIAFLSLLLVGSTGMLVLGDRQLESATASVLEGKKLAFELPDWDERLVDNKQIYETFEDSQLEAVYITVLPPKANGAIDLESLHEQVNVTNDVYHNDTEDPFVNIYFSDKEESVESTINPNGVMELRGQSSRIVPQKSYKIKLQEDQVKWKGLSTLNLNKHFEDTTRIKNKLSFDYFQMMTDIVSYRTQFVELYIRDLSEGSTQTDFESYGVFTFIEQPNKKYLKDHGMDPKGYFYKAEFFEFLRYEEDIKLKEEKGYSYEKFESKLETRGNEDHSALIEMLEAVNDYTRDINEVVAIYFEENNMLTWLAANILMNNFDTSSRNFMIYSALNSKKWYFIPWDYDKGWEEPPIDEEGWEFGLSNYWGMTLFNRYFKHPENVEKLNQKIEDLSKMITPQQTNKFIQGYRDEMMEKLYQSPDKSYLKLNQEEYLKTLNELSVLPEKSKQKYYEDLQRPMPFYLGMPEEGDDQVRLQWGAAFDLQGDAITYEVKVSNSPTFESLIYHETGIQIAEVVFPKLPRGDYYWSVIAKDDKGNRRYAFDYTIVKGKRYKGMGSFEIQ